MDVAGTPISGALAGAAGGAVGGSLSECGMDDAFIMKSVLAWRRGAQHL